MTLRKASRKFTATLSVPGIANATDTTFTLSSVVGLPTDTPVDITIDRVDSSGVLTPSKEEVITGTVSGGNIINAVRGVEGTAQAHASGAVCEVRLTASQWNAMSDAILAEHNTDGTHKVALTAEHNANGTHKPHAIYSPEGFLINGKIVPSVSSGDITVALKTLSGADPSATDPVYVMIGGVMRSITSALSFTHNAGTNYLNMGSAELATKEVDLFVYLFWSASNSAVVLAMSRIPYGTRFDSFTAAADVEKGIIASTWTATASDPGVVIGRFAATLSAGAGYTWSVPTFTATNLIQRPIYEARTVTTASGYLLSIIGRKAILQGEVASGTNTVTGLYGWYRTDVNTITYPITYSVAPKAIVTSKSDHAGVMTTSVTATTLSWRGYAGASVASPPSCYFLIIGEL